MKIIIFTDSLGRPRPDIAKEEMTVYEDVYGFKLKEYFKNKHDVELIYIDSLDTDDAVYWSQRMVAFRAPDLVIFQIGLNDCVPRIFEKNTRSVVLKPFFRKITFDILLKAISYFRLYITMLRKITYVPKERFSENILHMKNEIEKYNPNCNFISISIAKSEKLNQRSYNYNYNIEEYNKILQAVFDNTIEINDILNNDAFISDGMHLTKDAHMKLFHTLKRKIQRLEKCVE